MFNCLSEKIRLPSLTTIDLGYLGECKKTKNKKQKKKRQAIKISCRTDI
jgi:hypothetical protein